jgi:hypothetical protein
LAEILQPEQRGRLKQIDLQFQGADALRSPEVVKALALNIEQREKVNAAIKSADKHRDETVLPNQKIASIGMTPLELDEQLLETALNVLTPEQRTKLDGMKGRPLDLNVRAPYDRTGLSISVVRKLPKGKK